MSRIPTFSIHCRQKTIINDDFITLANGRKIIQYFLIEELVNETDLDYI